MSPARTADSVIVHDMKNLAFRLSALLQNMDENYDNPLFKKSMTDVLGDTIRKMDTIVKRFRENQQQIVVKLRVDINQILSELVAGIPQRTTRLVNIQSELEEIPLLWGDPYYLHTAFLSIMENALEAMPEGGTLSLRSRFTKKRGKPMANIEITDTGIGMSQAFLETKLFSPFVSTKQNGLGLGLFNCQQIFAMHHGRIEVESSPGSGTTFRVLLPCDYAES